MKTSYLFLFINFFFYYNNTTAQTLAGEHCVCQFESESDARGASYPLCFYPDTAIACQLTKIQSYSITIFTLKKNVWEFKTYNVKAKNNIDPHSFIKHEDWILYTNIVGITKEGKDLKVNSFAMYAKDIQKQKNTQGWYYERAKRNYVQLIDLHPFYKNSAEKENLKVQSFIIEITYKNGDKNELNFASSRIDKNVIPPIATNFKFKKITAAKPNGRTIGLENFELTTLE